MLRVMSVREKRIVRVTGEGEGMVCCRAVRKGERGGRERRVWRISGIGFSFGGWVCVLGVCCDYESVE